MSTVHPQDRGAVRYWVALNHVPGIGPARFAKLVDRFGDAEAAWRAPDRALAEVLDRRSLQSLLEVRQSLDPADAMGRVTALGAEVVTASCPTYPQQLRSIPLAPVVLYVLGRSSLLSSRGVAVVGTRKATVYGHQATERLAGDLASSGLTVNSGLAIGIDAAAHRAALDAGGDTIAVLGCGLDVVYPARNQALMARIAAEGAVVSEYPPGTQPEPGHFPARNRIVSGLSLATIVVEAGVRSGAQITARFAVDQGRDVFAVPGPIFSPQSAGANALIAAGAGVALSAEDVTTALSLTGLAAAEPVRCIAPGDPLEARLLEHMRSEARHIDDLGRHAGVDAPEVARTLVVMELKGMVRQLENMRWVAAP